MITEWIFSVSAAVISVSWSWTCRTPRTTPSTCSTPGPGLSTSSPASANGKRRPDSRCVRKASPPCYCNLMCHCRPLQGMRGGEAERVPGAAGAAPTRTGGARPVQLEPRSRAAHVQRARGQLRGHQMDHGTCVCVCVCVCACLRAHTEKRHGLERQRLSVPQGFLSQNHLAKER